jgi:amino acid transporter
MYHNNPNLYNYHLKYSSLIIILSVPSYWIQKYPKETNIIIIIVIIIIIIIIIIILIIVKNNNKNKTSP